MKIVCINSHCQNRRKAIIDMEYTLEKLSRLNAMENWYNYDIKVYKKILSILPT